MIPDADIVILGGGCAGLNLAARLGKRKRVLIIEPRTSYTHEHTWCFWRTHDHDLGHLVAHRWNRWRISTHEKAIVHDTPETPYEMIPSLGFYDWARSQIPEDRLMLDTRSSDPFRGQHFLEVPTPKGNITAKYVVDTRSPETTPNLVQEFVGTEIETDSFTYDMETVGLMDFRENTHFTYTLPLSPSRAFVQSTRFSLPEETNKQHLEKDLQTALPEIPFHTIRTESGLTPIGTPLPATPFTGYAFHRINRWAQACTKAILQGGAPIPYPPDPPAIRIIDRIFLNAFRQNPQNAPTLFLTLAKKVPSESIIRFLSGEATKKDLLTIIRALPAAHYLRALFP